MKRTINRMPRMLNDGTRLIASPTTGDYSIARQTWHDMVTQAIANTPKPDDKKPVDWNSDKA